MSDALSPAIYPAAPLLSLDGSRRADLSDALQGMVVEEGSDGLRHCELTLANWGPTDGGIGFLYFEAARLDFGMRLQIELAGGERGGAIFDGRVSAIEGRFGRERAPELVVLAEDRLQDLRMTRRTRSFSDMEDSAVFEQVARDHGLQSSIDVDGRTHRLLAQLNQSDLAFMRERARAVDAELWVTGTTLHVQARKRRQAQSLTLTYGENLLELSARADLSEQVTGFAVSGWSVDRKERINHRATDSCLGGELGRDTSGSSVLQRALGTRDQQLVHAFPCDAQEAQALAEAHYKRVARRFVTGTGATDGDARIDVGAQVTLAASGLFDGNYDVVCVRHVFDPYCGLRTQFQVERAGLAR